MKKKINIVLIVLVVSLWGGVFYKVVKQFLFKEEIQFQAHTVKKNVPLAFSAKDTFDFVQSNRDPFLNKLNASPKKNVPVAVINKTVPSKRPKPVLVEKTPARMFPTITYFGYMTSGTDKHSALLKINSKQVKLSENEEYEGLKLVKVYRDSVLVIFNSNKVMVRKAR